MSRSPRVILSRTADANVAAVESADTTLAQQIKVILAEADKCQAAVNVAPNSCFAPSALVPPGPAVAEGDEFDGRPLGSFGLHGQRFYEFQFAL